MTLNSNTLYKYPCVYVVSTYFDTTVYLKMIFKDPCKNIMLISLNLGNVEKKN